MKKKVLVSVPTATIPLNIQNCQHGIHFCTPLISNGNLVNQQLVIVNVVRLLDLLECTVDGRARVGALVEVDRRQSALADALRGEFEFLSR